MSHRFSKTKVTNYSSKLLLVKIILKDIDKRIAKGESIISQLLIAKTLELPAFNQMVEKVLETQKN
ncbi:hypothetical protein K5I29_02230 [Flavobacterium agricola]|uniref:Uncharacterized protein n=1 Tax=Flavobacterium agricola TaxID=2870839 RepID=A0ABY6LZM1_9FLAO|nr:hypothetical protein [Flavobacterium agricola]UYW01762.1 hypothetical protein K5I29_02230 [Flavobacterium agricola]